MDTYSIAEVAARLGTSVPRVSRCVARLELRLEKTTRGARVDETDLVHLANALGSVPASWSGTREEALVLAAVSRRPLGVRSTRAVARFAGVSPTTADRAVMSLTARGLVCVETARTIERRVLDVPLLVVDYSSPAWQAVSTIIRSVVLPSRPAERAPRRVPQRLWHHFWNGNPQSIALPRDADYVATRLLRSGDPQAYAWAASNLPSSAMTATAAVRGVDNAERSALTRLAQAAGRW
jgi:hypothetical protein